jgi:outer membrane protein assembly factor BamB
MKTVCAIIPILFILILSCKEDEESLKKVDENGVYISLPYLWKRTLHLSTPVSNSGILSPIYYGEKIIIPITNGDNNRLLGMINSNNGELIWKWDERYQPATEYEDISYYHQFNNLFYYAMGGRCYCINLDDGTTHWKIRRNMTFDSRINSYHLYQCFNYSQITNEDGNEEQVAFITDINTGEISQFLRANLSSEYVSPNGVGGIIYINTIPDNDSLLLVTYAEPLPEWEVNSFLGLYNSNTKVWVYERKLMCLPKWYTSVFTPPQIYNNRVYANVGVSIVCHDLKSGKQIWKKDFSSDFMFAGFIIAEDRLIASCENEILYCLDPDNGAIIWQTAGSGTSSRLAYLNGIVYFVGGGDGKFHAVEAASGKTVWLLDGAKLDGGMFASYNPVFVFPANNNQPAKVIALSLINAYCFEAYQ